MKIVNALFQGKYSLHTTYLDTTIQIEAIVEEGEAAESVLDQLKSRADKKIEEWRKENDAFTDGPGSELKHPTQVTFGQTPVIQQEKSDKEKEKRETAFLINNAANLTNLLYYKLIASSDPELYNLYMQKLKELQP